ncbi:MAG: TonB-dependent receptor [Candidatus Thiodiazotropha sp. (ex Ctena orbiculata)]|nr:TonB-dependent receptor [Candidatus Thiodiazotropha taylori]
MLYQIPFRSLFIISLFSGSLLAEETSSLGEMTVTVSKMSETLKEVPQSITVIDDAMLEERRITNVTELIRQIPNMHTIEGISRSETNVRGLNISTFTSTNPVVLYVDGIPSTSRNGYDIPLVDVERVEVLRGPQGTLYGKDAIGGVINVITKRPGETWEGHVGGELGSYDSRSLTFSANGPVSQDLFYAGVWGKWASDEGWIENENPALDDSGNDEEEVRAGLNLLLTPSDGFSARLHLMHEEHDKGFANGGVAAAGTDLDRVERSDFEHANFEEESSYDTEVDSQGLHLEYDSGMGTLQSITTHRETDQDGRIDVDYASGNPAFDNQVYNEFVTIETLSQELRWSHQLDSGMRWVAGLYFEQEETDFDNFGQQAFNMDFRWVSQNDSETQAVFGQLVLPFLDAFELTLGGRYQWIEKEIALASFTTPIVDGVINVGAPAFEINADETWTTFLPKAAISYRLDNDWTAYASVAEGYMPGGFNFVAFTPNVADNQFGPQESMSYELGAKGSLFDERLFLSTAAFYMDITDIHVFTFDNGIITTSNAAEGRSYGLEIEADYLISDRWQSNLALAVINAEYDDYTDTQGNVNDGNKIQRTPSHSINLGLQYTDPSGFYGRADLINLGKIYFDATNDLEENGYTLLNLKAGYGTESWEVYAYGNNLTDTDYKTFGMAGSISGCTLVEFGDPREVGVGMKYWF